MINKPNFLGVGMMKAATTWLSECLRYHPEVYISDVKEIHFFSKKWDKGVDWYYSHFEGVRGERMIGEFSNTYVDDVKYVHRIKDVLGDIKIIISLRDPIDRFVSHYKYIYRNDPKAKNIPLDKISFNTIKTIEKEFPDVLSRGLYFNMVNNYIEYFKKENVFIGFKEDIDRDPADEVKNLYRFIGVNDDFKPTMLNKQVSPGNVPKIYFLERMRGRIFKMMKMIFPRGIVWVRKLRLAEIYRKLNNRNSSIKIDSKALNWLKKYYEEDILQLEELLGKDLRIWRSYPD